MSEKKEQPGEQGAAEYLSPEVAKVRPRPAPTRPAPPRGRGGSGKWKMDGAGQGAGLIRHTDASELFDALVAETDSLLG